MVEIEHFVFVFSPENFSCDRLFKFTLQTNIFQILIWKHYCVYTNKQTKMKTLHYDANIPMEISTIYFYKKLKICRFHCVARKFLHNDELIWLIVIVSFALSLILCHFFLCHPRLSTLNKNRSRSRRSRD